MSQKGELVLAEHIDVILLGVDADNFVRLLQHPHQIESRRVNNQNRSYLCELKNMLKTSIQIETKKITGFQTLNLGNMTQITKSLLTKSLWLTIHFHYPNYQFYDVFLSDFIKGNCSIAIMIENDDDIGSQYKQITKKLASNQTRNLRFDNKEIQNNGKNQHYFQSHVLSKTHSPILAQFDNVLNLKIQGNKLMQTHMGIKMTVNQVLRWIAERHFQSVHHLKMTKAMGDEIQSEPKNEEIGSCKLV